MLSDNQRGRTPSDCIEYHRKVGLSPKFNAVYKDLFRKENKEVCKIRPCFERFTSTTATFERSPMLSVKLPSMRMRNQQIINKEPILIENFGINGSDLVSNVLQDYTKWNFDMEFTNKRDQWTLNTNELKKARDAHEFAKDKLFSRAGNKFRTASIQQRMKNKIVTKLDNVQSLQTIKEKAALAAKADFLLKDKFAGKFIRVKKEVTGKKYTDKKEDQLTSHKLCADEDGHLYQDGLRDLHSRGERRNIGGPN